MQKIEISGQGKKGEKSPERLNAAFSRGRINLIN